MNRLNSTENWSTPSTRFPLFIGLGHFYAAQLQLSSVFFIVMSVCLSQPWTVLMVTRQLADMPTREITWSLCKKDWTDRVAIWRVDWPRPVSFCVRRVSHPKSAVRDVSWRRSLLVIKYFAALYLANGSSRRSVKIEHYLEVAWLYKNVGRPTEVIQSHVNAEGRIDWVSECECGHNNKCWVL